MHAGSDPGGGMGFGVCLPLRPFFGIPGASDPGSRLPSVCLAPAHRRPL